MLYCVTIDSIKSANIPVNSFNTAKAYAQITMEINANFKATSSVDTPQVTVINSRQHLLLIFLIHAHALRLHNIF